jgi:hypothetical protein
VRHYRRFLRHRRLSSICASACYKVIIGRATPACIVMCGKFPYSEDHCVLHIPHDRAMDHFVNYVHSSSVDGGEHYVQDAKYGIDNQGCLCVRPSVCPSVTSDKVHVRLISKYSSIFEHIEHILENIHRICLLRPIPNRQNRQSIRPSRPSMTSLPPNTSDMTTLLITTSYNYP